MRINRGDTGPARRDECGVSPIPRAIRTTLGMNRSTTSSSDSASASLQLTRSWPSNVLVSWRLSVRSSECSRIMRREFDSKRQNHGSDVSTPGSLSETDSGQCSRRAPRAAPARHENRRLQSTRADLERHDRVLVLESGRLNLGAVDAETVVVEQLLPAITLRNAGQRIKPCRGTG